MTVTVQYKFELDEKDVEILKVFKTTSRIKLMDAPFDSYEEYKNNLSSCYLTEEQFKLRNPFKRSDFQHLRTLNIVEKNQLNGWNDEYFLTLLGKELLKQNNIG